MRLVLLLALLAAAPVQAQPDFSDVTPDGVLAATWNEALGGAEAVAWALDDVAADTLGAPAEAVGDANRARATAAVAAAATAATLVPAMQFSIALAGPSEQAAVQAALAEDVLGLHTLLMLVAETVDPPPPDPTLRTARARSPDGTPAAPGDAAPEDWAARAAQIRTLAARLGGAVAALGLADDRP